MISIKYIESRQACRISSDIIDKDWKQIRFYYNQISDQSEIFENSIELPWHTFIANYKILADVVNLYNIKVEFSPEAKSLFVASREFRKKIADIESQEPIPSDKLAKMLADLGFQRTLTKEQLRNVSKLSRLPIGATFSVPGAGKTTEAIAFFILNRSAKEKLLVICPKNAFPAWEEQLSICLKSANLLIKRLTQGNEKIESALSSNQADVFLISYQQYVRSCGIIAKYLHHNQTFVFIDESHRMKGGTRTDTGRQIQKIAHLPVGKLIMSGTPMPQGEADLIPQYLFLFPSDGDVKIENVKEKIKKIYVRTTKNELLNPREYPLNVIKTPIPLNEPQKKVYDLVRSEEFRKASNIGNNDKKLFRLLGRSYIRLLQIVTNPSLLIKATNNFPDALREAIEYGDSNKIKYIVLKARQLAKEGKKTLIWSGFVENVESLTSMLSDLGAKCIHGGVEAGSDEEEDTRESIVKEFHDNPNMYVLVANPAACSEGISLHTVCHHSIYMDRNYNAAQFLQSMDRIHRLGLIKGTVTTIEIVHTPDSIDDLINARLNDKINRMAAVLEDESLRKEPVTVELDEDGFDEEDAKQLLRHLKGLL